jgi:hypothetical protein
MANLKEMYVHCSLQKREGTSTLHRTIWANADKATVGRIVKIEEDNGEWTQGWEVMAVHGEPRPKDIVQHQSHAYTRQRKASDI